MTPLPPPYLEESFGDGEQGPVVLAQDGGRGRQQLARPIHRGHHTSGGSQRLGQTLRVLLHPVRLRRGIGSVLQYCNASA